MTLSTSRKTEGGFTLVELAIVLMIIGLLIGGILRGQELMENARVTSTIQQTKAYDGATTTFADQYSALPGDISRPDLRLPNCGAIPCSTPGSAAAGTGDNIIGVSVSSKTATYTPGNVTENRKYWLHLAVSRLISGIDAGGSNVGGAWGVEYPAAKIAGGFHVVYVNITAAPSVSGHFLVLRNAANDGRMAELAGQSAISPLRAAQIDRKIDDGLPNSGDVQGLGTTTDCTGVTVNGTLQYGETVESRDCNLLIRVQA